jgi:mRNA interferase RelE/StbE
LAWTVKLSSGAERQLRKLDLSTAKRLATFLQRLVTETNDPRDRGKALTGPLAGLWRYRVGDYRLICELVDERLVVLVVRLGHRSQIYASRPSRRSGS